MIYVFLADGFEEIEALATVDILRRANIETKTVGVGTKFPTGTHGIKVEADILVEDTVTDSLEGVVLPGGLPGAWNLKASGRVEELTRYCHNNGKLVSAIGVCFRAKMPFATPVLRKDLWVLWLSMLLP